VTLCRTGFADIIDQDLARAFFAVSKKTDLCSRAGRQQGSGAGPSATLS
jgi:hypothetical protein